MSRFVALEFRPGEHARLYVPEAAAPHRAGAVVFHPWWGLNQDVLDFADRLAGEGFAVVAPDLFGGRVESTIEGAQDAADAADRTVVGAIVLAAVDWLAARLDTGAGVAVLGFSYGAAWSIWAPTRRPGLRATVVYYGTWTGPVIAAASVPVLGHFAERDPYEPAEGVAEFETALREANRETEIYRYPGTGHWFAEPGRADAYDAPAAELAFARTLAFLHARLDGND